jgi:hypothetical protein
VPAIEKYPPVVERIDHCRLAFEDLKEGIAKAHEDAGDPVPVVEAYG